MDVFELLKHYELDSISEKEQELFAYFGYAYGIENDENNHPLFYVRLFSKITRIPILEFSISYKGGINYFCNICRDKQPCYHFSILVTKLLKEESEQLKAMSERFAFEISDVDRREQQSAFDYELEEVFKKIKAKENTGDLLAKRDKSFIYLHIMNDIDFC